MKYPEGRWAAAAEVGRGLGQTPDVAAVADLIERVRRSWAADLERRRVACVPPDRELGNDVETAEPVGDPVLGPVLPGVHYVARSSADVEHHGARSFAGKNATVLDVAGESAVLAAVQKVLCSVRADRVRDDARHVGVDPEALRMAVIVQRMVPPVASGSRSVATR